MEVVKKECENNKYHENDLSNKDDKNEGRKEEGEIKKLRGHNADTNDELGS